jgi:hypothetical protein
LNISPSMYPRRIPLSLIVLLLLTISVCNCKKNPITSDPESLTRPVIWLNVFEMAFAAAETGPNPLSQVLRIKNAGQGTLKYDISADADWLKVEPAGGSSSGQAYEHAVTVNKTGLAAQDSDYTATITVASADAYNNPQKVKISLKISKEPPPEISVSPQALSFAAQTGGSNPPQQSISIRNGGGGTLDYVITWAGSWLSVAPPNGSSTGQQNRHTVSASSRGLAAGVYNGMITITSSHATNSPQQVGVTLRVGSIPTNNEIRVSCSPSEGRTGATISVPISIVGNTNEILAFGLQLTFDTNMFQYVGTSKGSLTGSWAFVDGNTIGGTVTIGGLAGSGNPIPVGSSGTIAVVTLRVTGGSYSNGQQTQIVIQGYADDITGMKPEPTSATFTYRK